MTRTILKIRWTLVKRSSGLPKRGLMKSMTLLGAVLLALGLLSFVVPVPHHEDHGIQVGDAKIGVQTEHSERVAPWISGVLLCGGIVIMLAGSRKP